jgi:5-methylcytosine-specific restriction endonuclease McrA
MDRKPPFNRCERRSLPDLLRAKIMLRQKGCCFDCGTRMILGKIVFDHRPPLAFRAENDEANDPDRIVAICRSCDQQKTPRDLKEIARIKRIARNHQDFLERMRDKVPGRPVPSRSQWRKMMRRFGATQDTLGS